MLQSVKMQFSAALLILTLSDVLTAHPQSGNPTFELASIRPSPRDGGQAGINRTAGQFTTSNLSLPFLIRWAYDLDEDRLLGVPKVFDSVMFDITAKIPADEKLIPGLTLRLMMQNLLAERFKLLVHRETRELQSYALITEKGGPKVRFVDPTQPVGMSPFNMTDRGRILGTRVTAEMLAKVLADQLKRPVEDLTGITMPFDFTLEWMPDSTADQSETVAANSIRASIFTALKEQLGFSLNPRKSAVEVIVIDHVETVPTEN
jgi:uncharacterized protein (TIGR03435 family)